ncbi:MAG: 50S ribosomal protein L17 [Bacteroidetes bacterium]|jgi:large subunit ribosomal protein L17|nr:50S ribosomal protein L17 [Bacteroidota bacterium]
MRHGKKFNHLGRTAPHRKAMLRNMASSLILHKRITTTLAKAKALQRYVEPVINRSRGNEEMVDIMNASRYAFRYLQDKTAVKELFAAVSGKVTDRNGGFTRIVKLGTRLGDNAELAMIELVDFNEIYTQNKGAATAQKGRRRRKKSGGAKPEGESPANTPTASTMAPVLDGEPDTALSDMSMEAANAELNADEMPDAETAADQEGETETKPNNE